MIFVLALFLSTPTQPAFRRCFPVALIPTWQQGRMIVCYK